MKQACRVGVAPRKERFVARSSQRKESHGGSQRQRRAMRAEAALQRYSTHLLRLIDWQLKNRPSTRHDGLHSTRSTNGKVEGDSPFKSNEEAERCYSTSRSGQLALASEPVPRLHMFESGQMSRSDKRTPPCCCASASAAVQAVPGSAALGVVLVV